MPQLNIRVDQDLFSRFYELCDERATTASEVIRAAIAAFVERDMVQARERQQAASRDDTREWDHQDRLEEIKFPPKRAVVNRLDKACVRKTMKGSK